MVIDELNCICSVENELKPAQSWYGPLCFGAFIKSVRASFGSGTPSVLLQCGADVKIL